MSQLKDLDYTSILDMGSDEAIERLRQIRLSRRVPVKSRKASKTIKKAKATSTPKLSAEQAAELLKQLGEE